MRVFVLGGSGFIGAVVAVALRDMGHEVIVGARKSGDLSIDRNDPAVVARLIARERCSVMIDMIAYEPHSTMALRKALGDDIERYVLVSSADVYRNYGGLHRLEEGEPIFDHLTEDSPLRTRLYPYRTISPRTADAPDAWKDAYDKIPTERAVAGPSVTIVRLPMVYGPGDRNRRFAWIVTPMKRGAATIVAPAAWLSWVTTYGHVNNVAAAIALCATNSAAAGRTYNCGERPVSHAEWIARFAALAGWSGEVVHDEAGPLAGAIGAMDLHYPLALSTDRIRSELGYAEVMASDDAALSVLSEDRTLAH